MRDLDREATEEQIRADGGLSYSFLFLVVASCGIATLGLMLNSAEVIIGAMLVAVLSGMVAGYAVTHRNIGTVAGVAIAFSVAAMAVWYGFGNFRTPKHLVWQATVAAAVLATLSVPLFGTLDESVSRTLVAKSYPLAEQRKLKRESGQAGMRSARIRPLFDAEEETPANAGDKGAV